MGEAKRRKKAAKSDYGFAGIVTKAKDHIEKHLRDPHLSQHEKVIVFTNNDQGCSDRVIQLLETELPNKYGNNAEIFRFYCLAEAAKDKPDLIESYGEIKIFEEEIFSKEQYNVSKKNALLIVDLVRLAFHKIINPERAKNLIKICEETQKLCASNKLSAGVAIIANFTESIARIDLEELKFLSDEFLMIFQVFGFVLKIEVLDDLGATRDWQCGSNFRIEPDLHKYFVPSDDVVQVNFVAELDGRPFFETLNCKKVEFTRVQKAIPQYIVLNTPFFAENVALGDIFFVKEDPITKGLFASQKSMSINHGTITFEIPEDTKDEVIVELFKLSKNGINIRVHLKLASVDIQAGADHSYLNEFLQAQNWEYKTLSHNFIRGKHDNSGKYETLLVETIPDYETIYFESDE